MSNKSVQISDKLIQWEDDKNPLAPLSQTQINAYLSLSEYIGNTTDVIVCVLIINILLKCIVESFFLSVFRT
jgi:hypothetical protein